jgi:hypothetical protein
VDAEISGGGNSRMRLPDYGERESAKPLADEIRGRLLAAVVNDDDFECRGGGLLAQGMQASIERCPVVISGYDNAKSKGSLGRLASNHSVSFGVVKDSRSR